MKYFKLMNGNEFIGAISSDNFICYIEGCGYMHTNETYGEYVEYENAYYRTTWMKAPHTLYNYTEVSILPITRDEYLIYLRAKQNNEVIIDDDEEEEEPVELTPEQLADVEFVRYVKNLQMSKECNRVIEEGIDVEMHGAIKHFSLTKADQINLINLSSTAEDEDIIPYHADGEDVIFYSGADIKKIAKAAQEFKIYQTTYYHSLRNYINSLQSITDIDAIIYGVDIPEEYQSDVLKELGGKQYASN